MSNRHKDEHDVLLWIDLECTGDSIDDGDEIVEIGCLLTDQQLNPSDGGDLGWTAVIDPTPPALARLRAHPIVADMHTRSGLLRDLDNGLGIPLAVAEADLCAWLDHQMAKRFPKARKAVLAGSGVGHFDKPFIWKYLPDLASRLRYYTIDIGNTRRFWRMCVGSDLVPLLNDSKPHRAFHDIGIHLAEARAFRARWREMDAAAQAAAGG